MTRSYVDKNEAVAALRSLAPRMAQAIRGIRDPNGAAVGSWSRGDVAVHLGDVVVELQNSVRGRGTGFDTPEQIGGYYQKRLDARPERDMSAAAGRFEQELSAFLDVVEATGGDPLVPWAQFRVPVSTTVSTYIGECLVHGWDVTHAEGRPWEIDAYRAALSIRGISPLTMNFVDDEVAAGFSGTFDVRMRGQSSLHFVFTNGELAIEEVSEHPVDVHISADPVAFLLVGYGRLSQWGPILKGQMVTWGRKPWLSFKFPKLLRNP